MKGKKHILLVEDYEPMSGAIKSVLEMEGYAVSAASDGTEALHVMDEMRPDLVIADILMPEMDGYALYEEIRKRPEWHSIPFIFLTSMAEREDIERGRELGVDTYITKPFDPEQLLTAVRAELKETRSAQDALGSG